MFVSLLAVTLTVLTSNLSSNNEVLLGCHCTPASSVEQTTFGSSSLWLTSCWSRGWPNRHGWQRHIPRPKKRIWQQFLCDFSCCNVASHRGSIWNLNLIQITLHRRQNLIRQSRNLNLEEKSYSQNQRFKSEEEILFLNPETQNRLDLESGEEIGFYDLILKSREVPTWLIRSRSSQMPANDFIRCVFVMFILRMVSVHLLRFGSGTGIRDTLLCKRRRFCCHFS